MKQAWCARRLAPAPRAHVGWVVRQAQGVGVGVGGRKGGVRQALLAEGLVQEVVLGHREAVALRGRGGGGERGEQVGVRGGLPAGPAPREWG